MSDPTEQEHRKRLAEINAQPKSREELQALYGQVWDTRELFGRTETRLYVCGKLVGTGPATRPDGGTTFVVGNVGRDNPIDYFRGRVRSVRISLGERYGGDFVPDEQFVKDAEGAPAKAVLIYNGSAVDGDRVIDLSGAGNHGRWERTPP
jgi:hypothetical protein